MSSRPQKAFARMAVAVLLPMSGAACADLLSPGEEQPRDQLLFLRHADGNSVPAPQSRQTDIYRMNADGSGVRDLTAHPGEYVSLSVSPDGGRVAFASTRSGRSQVWVMNTDGSGLSQLTNVYDAGTPRWSPDGSLIAFQGYDPSVGVHVYVMNADGSNLRNVSSPAVGSCTAGDTRTNIELIGWIPDGRLAFSRYVCREGYRFYTVNGDGGGFARTDFDLNHAYWSPDGARVAFNRREGAQTRVFVMNADGSGVQRLPGAGSQSVPGRMNTRARSDYTPWSPDGTRLVVQSDSASACHSQVVHVDGSGVRQLTDAPCREFEFNGWSPAGDRLAFTGWKDGRLDVYTLKPDGTGLVNLTRSTVPLSSAVWLPRRD